MNIIDRIKKIIKGIWESTAQVDNPTQDDNEKILKEYGDPTLIATAGKSGSAKSINYKVDVVSEKKAAEKAAKKAAEKVKEDFIKE